MNLRFFEAEHRGRGQVRLEFRRSWSRLEKSALLHIKKYV
jgi:hypothetical protein